MVSVTDWRQMCGSVKGMAPAAPERRRYDSPVRREQAALTRERILTAAVDLGRGLRSWDWRGVTVAAVAARAGVHERTVFRHFPSEADLRREVADRLERQAGVLAGVPALAAVPGLVRQLFAFLADLPGVTAERRIDPALASVDARRRDGMLGAVAAAQTGLTDLQQRQVAALLDAVATPATFRRLAVSWSLSPAEAGAAAAWLTSLVVDAVGRADAPQAD